MARSYTERTIKILFALSGNRCAFPMCPVPLVDIHPNDPDPIVLGELCHIIASSPTGPRGAASPAPGARDSHRNLILLCPTHHTLIDARPAQYPPQMLRGWKAQTELRASQAPFRPVSSGSTPDEIAAASQLRSHLDGLTQRSMLRSERIDDGPLNESESLRLSESLYVERDIEPGLASRLTPSVATDRAVLLVGEPGVGKTSLLWSIVSQALAQGQTAWLLQADSLLKLFDESASPSFPVHMLDQLCRQAEYRSAPPLLAIDTADLCLSTGRQSDRFTELLSYLQQVNIRMLIASRPQESEELRFLNPTTEVLGDYSESEFVQAVQRYAQAYLGDSAPERCSEIARELQDSAAQGFPIREVAFRPLTLRMLFSIYAPDDINHAEINIVELYDEFWRRRVQDDVRAGSRGSETQAIDLSEAARLLGVKMLGEGTPDIPLETARSAFKLAKIDIAELDQLASRGVIHYAGTGRNRTVSFFHQTFFEHAAAEAIASAPDAVFLLGLHDQFLATGGNQFLGCVLERALVLAETRSTALRKASYDVTLALVRGDEPFLSAGIYAFAHRSSPSPDMALEVQTKIEAGHAPTIERLLAVAPNMGRERRLTAVTMLGAALVRGEHRRNEKIFHFFRRAADQFPKEVIGAIQASGLMEEFDSDALATGMARMNFYALAPKLAPTDPAWVFGSLTDLAVSSLARFAGERDFERACDAIAACADLYPDHAKAFVAAIRRAAEGSAGLNTGYQETRAFALLLAGVTRKCPMEFLMEAQAAFRAKPSQFLVRAHLAAAALTASVGDLEQLAALIRRCAEWSDKQLFHSLGATTLSMLIERSAQAPAEQLDHLLSTMCDEIVALEPAARSLVESGLLQGEQVPVAALPAMISRLGHEPSYIWEPEGLLFHRVVEAGAAGLDEAERSIERQVRNTPPAPNVAQKLLLQMRRAPDSAAARRHALELALATSSPADATIALLERTEAITPEWISALPDVEALALSRLKLGDPVNRTRGAKLMQQLARLTARTPLNWDELLARGLHERNEAARTAFLGAVRYLMIASPADWESRLHKLLSTQLEGDTARGQAFGAIGSVLKLSPELCERYFERFFEAVFRGRASAEAVMSLAGPMYLLQERGWSQLPDFCERLIDQSVNMSSKTCQRIYRVYAKLYLDVAASAGSAWCLGLLRRVPTLHPEVARLVLPLGLSIENDEFRQLIEFYATFDDLPGGTLTKISDLRTIRERRTGVSVSRVMVTDYIARKACA